MDRRSFLALAGGLTLAGCTASTPLRRSPDGGSTPTRDCPPLSDVDRTVCPVDESGPLAVARSSASVSGADWPLQVTVANRAEVPYSVNPFAWSLHHRNGGRWDRHSASEASAPRVKLQPGARYVWSLSRSADDSEVVDHRIIAALDRGTYAFAVPFTGPARVAAVAGFTVTA